ncbi:TolC family protein [Vulgatibacter incomptus]|uniref:Heavy metal RND efflux outer membrane protein, CzcC family n=1 Tax=Vulgatibacter incomptus TaxID=1391653 RepID=A0A0K1PH85_9BACT|nr:TolC family protein [Vulgatibacter incomptus]AKU92484.1 Heavy metal RND efflux outer membrane protein, CzcC family [Vulgatibacter incomptus]
MKRCATRPWLLLLWLATAAAAPLEPSEPRRITFDEAIALAGEAPSVAAAREAAREKRAIDGSISGLGNPELVVTPGIRANSDVQNGLAGEATLVQPIPLSSLGSARRDAARAEERALTNHAAAATLGIRLDAATSFCSLWGTAQALERATEEVELAEDLLARLQKGAEAGVFTASEVAEARTYLGEARLARVSLEGDAHDRGLELARKLQLARPTPLVAAGELPGPTLPGPEELERRLASIDELPAVALSSVQAVAARARVREREAEAAPWLGLGAKFSQEAPGDRAWFGIVSLSIPIFDRGQRDRGTLAAAAAESEGGKASALADGRAMAVMFVHEVEHTAEALEVIEEVLLPAARDAARLVELELSAGEATAIDLLRARRNLAQAAARAQLARADAAAARARLALLLEAIPAKEAAR